MDVPWLPAVEAPAAVDVAPPWVQHSRLQTQQELCAKRFLRFSSLHQVHGAVFIWAAALFFAGVHVVLAVAPLVYFTGLVFLARRRLHSTELEHISAFILVLNASNALHLAALCILEGDRVLPSPLFACLPLSRVLFGLFTQELHCHLGLSTLLAVLAISCNSKRVAGGEALLVVVAHLLIELTVVSGLAEGPCGYEEAVMNLAQCRAQHQLARSQAVQRLDLEREEFSGHLLAVATQGIADLTAAVQWASEPVLDMLKSSCATGTKSAQEAERIGRIGEALKDEVAKLLRNKLQTTSAQLQEQTRQRIGQLRIYAEEQQASTDRLLAYLHQNLGRSLTQMQELEMEGESLEQLIQGEVTRARETADARMDLVRQSAHAMECRVSDTVEVLLSLLKYFRSKGSSNVVVVASATPARQAVVRQRRADTEGSRKTQGSVSPSRPLPAIRERGLLADPSVPDNFRHFNQPARDAQGNSVSGESEANHEDDGCTLLHSSSQDVLVGSGIDLDSSSSNNSANPKVSSTSAHSSDSAGTTLATPSSGSPRSMDVASENASDEGVSEGSTGTFSSSKDRADLPKPHQASQAGDQNCGNRSSLTSSRQALERHPLFASRLCYQSDNFFWSWASSRDFRAEADALRQWQRASAASSGSTTHGAPGAHETSNQSAVLASPCSTNSENASSVEGSLSCQLRPSRALAPFAQNGPSSVFIDLSAVQLHSRSRLGNLTGGSTSCDGQSDYLRLRRTTDAHVHKSIASRDGFSSSSEE